MDNSIYWIWLSLAAGPCSTLPQRLINKYDNDIKKIYEEKDYKDLKLTPKQTKNLQNKDLETCNEIIKWCKQNKVGVLCYSDDNFPERLRSLPDAPIVLYYIGELYDIDRMLCLAGVGTRDMTSYGRDTAYSFSYDLARAGAIIVSGLATGIDTTCHRACLDAGGKTIAVLGCRISKVYPAINRDIMIEIARKGLIITEYHPFYHTAPSNFPQRNRIISGLCQGTIVFEADISSGSLITANYALKQGRRVYSLPGKIGDINSLGTNELIRSGAKMVTRASDIIDDYAFIYSDQINTQRLFDYSPAKKAFDSFIKRRRSESQKPDRTEKKITAPPADMDTDGLGDLERRIYNAMVFEEPMSVDRLVFPDTEFGDIMAALTMLELSGHITAKPGNTFIKNPKKTER